MKPLLIGTGAMLTSQRLGGRTGEYEVRRVRVFPAVTALEPGRPTIVLLDRTLLPAAEADRQRVAKVAERAAIVGHGAAGENVPHDDFPLDLLAGYVPVDAPQALLAIVLRAALRHASALVAARQARTADAVSHRRLVELTRAGLALGAERDPAALLETILTQARRITRSDAGSIYLIARGHPGTADAPVLQFRLAQNFSVAELPLASFTVPLDHTSLAGHAASTGRPLVVRDVALLPPESSYQANHSFDERLGYQTKSVLVIPMKSQRDEVVGVLQLINAKRSASARLTSAADVEREVVPFDPRAMAYVTALAAQAAVSIENSMLYANIERLFSGFVSAAATAVEARDPATYGHSRRVADLAVRLAEAVNAGLAGGAYRALRFSREQLLELRYAALLHDFGKVAVREAVLGKERKLHPHVLDAIRARAVHVVQQAELDCERDKVALLRAALTGAGASDVDARLAALDAAVAARRAVCDRLVAAVVRANEPADEPPGEPGAAMRELADLAGITYRDRDGSLRPLLTADELRHLQIGHGNLDDAERAEVESHVTHTFRFLDQIPWTPELAAVPHIAYAHHERPDGKGYPRGLRAPEIPTGAALIAVADIFDALTSANRSYQRAVSAARAVEIMRARARAGALDPDLVDAFAAAQLYDTPATDPSSRDGEDAATDEPPEPDEPPNRRGTRPEARSPARA